MTFNLRPYSEYKESGLPWTGRIPCHWSVKRGKTLFSESQLPVRNGDDVVTCFRDGQVTLRRNRRTSGFMMALLEAGYQGVRKGQLVIHAMDAFAGAIGVSDSNGKCTPEYVVVNPRSENVLPGYFALLLRYAALQGFILVSCPAVRERAPRFRYPNFGSMEMPLPPLDEQRAIFGFLSWANGRLERAIRAKKKLIALLNEQKQRLTQEAITSPSTKLHRMRDLVTNPNRMVERVEYQEYTPIGLYNWGRGIFHKTPTCGQELGDSVFFWLEEGDLVFSGQFAWEGAVSLARRKDHRCIASHRYPVFISKTASLRTSYLESFFQSSAGQLFMDANSRGAAGRNRPLNTRSLLREMIPVPSIAEQLTIEEFGNHLQGISDVVGRQITLIREYRTRLIADVVTGKVDVRHLAPSEPLPADEQIDEGIDDEEMRGDDESELDEEASDADD